jgi:glycosyl hydrolase family 106( putative alpha-L-rhamnosidase)
VFVEIDCQRLIERLQCGIVLLLFLAPALFAQDPISSLRQDFLNPPADARPIMRWWWFGPAVTKPELKRELETLQRAGIGGVEIQPVYPLMLDDPAKGIKNLQYLSPEFLDDLRFANETARSLNLRVDITLGSGWPYGGPKTTLDLAAGRLRVVDCPVTSAGLTPSALAPGEHMIAAFAIKGTRESFDPATAKQIDPASTLAPGNGATTVLYFISSHTGQMVKRAASGAEGYVLDHFARAAIDEHLSDVATPLLRAFGASPPYSVFSDSLEVYDSDWTLNLPAEFKERRGYDIVPHLPELIAGDTDEAASIRHDWGQTLDDLIRENYLEPLTRFAETHRTLFRSQTYGDPAVTLADESIASLPEGEGPQWRTFSYTRWASSASHLSGRNVTSAETWTWLHSPAFRATPLDMKVEADRMFLLGVNQLVGHGYPYSPAAAGEPGWSFYAAAVFNDHNPWFAVMPEITKYLQRVSWLLRRGKPANDVAILLPEDDGQSDFTLGHVSVTEQMDKRITGPLMSAILDAGYNIDYIDAATVHKLGAIPYSILVLPPTNRIPLAAYRLIQSYAVHRGTVIAVGSVPHLAPGLTEQGDSAAIDQISSDLFRNPGHVGVLVNSASELPAALHRALPPDVKATGGAAGIGFIHRKLKAADLYFVVNSTNQPIKGSVEFRSKHGAIEALDPDQGTTLETMKGSPVELSLAPYESRVFILHDRTMTYASGRPSRYFAEGANELPLIDISHDWNLQFVDQAHSQLIRDLVSWTDLPDRKFFSGETIYTRSLILDSKSFSTPNSALFLDFGAGTPTVDARPPDAPGIHALLDPPIREAAIVLVNGKRAGTLWHPPYRLDVTKLMHPGENRIEVHVYNTAINLLSGQPPRDYTALRAIYGRRFDPQDMDNLKPVPSGLLGPVHLIEERAR